MVSHILSPAILLGFSAIAVAQLQCPGIGVTTIGGIATSISCTSTVVSGYPASACVSVTLKSGLTSTTLGPVTTSLSTPTLTTPTTSALPTGQLCNGNLNNCVGLLSDAIIKQVPLSGTESAAIQAARLALQNGGKAYAYTADTVYALSLTASEAAARLNAQPYLKVNGNCASLVVNRMVTFDVTCLSDAQKSVILGTSSSGIGLPTTSSLSVTLPSTRVSATLSTSLSLSIPSTSLSVSLPTTSLSVSLPSTSLSVSLPSTSLSVSLPSTSLSVSLPSTSLTISVPSTSLSVTLPTIRTSSITLPSVTLPATTSIPQVTTTSTPQGQLCNGDVNNCIEVLSGDIISAEKCSNQGAACASNVEFITQAARLAQDLGGLSYALNPSTGFIYALRVPAAQAAVQLNANAYLKTSSPTCQGVAVNGLYLFDFACSGLPATTVGSNPTSGLPTTNLPTTLPSTRLPTTLPSTIVPTSGLPTTLPTTLPSIIAPTSGLPTTLPTTLPSIVAPTSGLPTTLPTTRLPTTLPATTIPTTLVPTTRLPTSIISTTIIPNTPLPTPLCNVPVSICSGETGLVSTRDCSGLNLVKCLFGGASNLLGATANLCALQGCGSYGIANGNIQVTSPLSVQGIMDAVAEYKAQHNGQCTVALTATLNDALCPTVK